MKRSYKPKRVGAPTARYLPQKNVYQQGTGGGGGVAPGIPGVALLPSGGYQPMAPSTPPPQGGKKPMNTYGSQGCGAGQLPTCNIRGASELLPAVPNECAQYAQNASRELCVIQAGGETLNASVAGPISVTITPNKATAFWGQLLRVCIFDTGVQTVVSNAVLNDIQIRGASQLASPNVPVCGFGGEMPFLGVSFDKADATNPITLTFTVRAAGNVDVLVFCTGYAVR